MHTAIFYLPSQEIDIKILSYRIFQLSILQNSLPWISWIGSFMCRVISSLPFVPVHPASLRSSNMEACFFFELSCQSRCTVFLGSSWVLKLYSSYPHIRLSSAPYFTMPFFSTNAVKLMSFFFNFGFTKVN